MAPKKRSMSKILWTISPWPAAHTEREEERGTRETMPPHMIIWQVVVYCVYLSLLGEVCGYSEFWGHTEKLQHFYYFYLMNHVL